MRTFFRGRVTGVGGAIKAVVAFFYIADTVRILAMPAG
jgi:hypothetical protein